MRKEIEWEKRARKKKRSREKRERTEREEWVTFTKYRKHVS